VSQLDLFPVITGVSHEAQWPTWANTEKPWSRLDGILQRPTLAGYIWLSDGYADPDSDYVRRFGLAWCCVVVAAVLSLRGGR
jgi:hypothetical protein